MTRHLARLASVRRSLLIALGFVCALVAAGYLWVHRDTTLRPSALTCSVRRGRFVHEIKVNGEVESAANTEVRCEVRPLPEIWWMRILEVVEDGTHVEPGDFLVRLDSSPWETELNLQSVHCQQVNAELAGAQNNYELAVFAEQEYLNGEYRLAKQDAELTVFNADEKLRKAKRTSQSSRMLQSAGFITEQQLAADQFALQAAETEAKMARRKLDLLENFTKPSKMKQIEADLVVARAKLAAAEVTSKRNEDRLHFLEEQVRKCVVRAPVAGEVVLNHLNHVDHWHMVAPGEQTMERRVLVKLPDPRRMRVKAKIEEDKMPWLHPGLQAVVELEAFPHKTLRGEVVRVAEYPNAEEYLGSAVKKYETLIRICEPLPGMRPGLSANVRILLDREENQLQVPCQAVFKHGEKNYTILDERGKWLAREVAVGANNGETVVIRGGLSEGQHVLLGAASYRDKIALPFVPRKKAAGQPLAFNR